MAYADLIVPRGGENAVAINLIVQHVRSQLLAKGHKLRESLIADGNDFDLEDSEMPSSLHLLPSSPQTKGLNTFLRNKVSKIIMLHPSLDLTNEARYNIFI